jgi:hypothetical protein
MRIEMRSRGPASGRPTVMLTQWRDDYRHRSLDRLEGRASVTSSHQLPAFMSRVIRRGGDGGHPST